jgi:hypothetical protein
VIDTNWLKDEKGNRYQKEQELVEVDLWKVMVVQDRDYDWTFTWEWTFDNEQDAQDKVTFINEEWKEYPMTKYDSVWYFKLALPKGFIKGMNSDIR